MKDFLVILFIMIFIPDEIKAQIKVKRKSFNTFLNIILNHNVKKITVPVAKKSSTKLLDARAK